MTTELDIPSDWSVTDWLDTGHENANVIRLSFRDLWYRYQDIDAGPPECLEGQDIWQDLRDGRAVTFGLLSIRMVKP